MQDVLDAAAVPQPPQPSPEALPNEQEGQSHHQGEQVQGIGKPEELAKARVRPAFPDKCGKGSAAAMRGRFKNYLTVPSTDAV